MLNGLLALHRKNRCSDLSARLPALVPENECEFREQLPLLGLNPVAAQVGLPMFSFVLLGSFGLQSGLASKYREIERRKNYVPPEEPEKILEVTFHAAPAATQHRTGLVVNGLFAGESRTCKKSCLRRTAKTTSRQRPAPGHATA